MNEFSVLDFVAFRKPQATSAVSRAGPSSGNFIDLTLDSDSEDLPGLIDSDSEDFPDLIDFVSPLKRSRTEAEEAEEADNDEEPESPCKRLRASLDKYRYTGKGKGRATRDLRTGGNLSCRLAARVGNPRCTERSTC